MGQIKTPVGNETVDDTKYVSPDNNKRTLDGGDTDDQNSNPDLPDGVTKSEDGNYYNADKKQVNELGQLLKEDGKAVNENGEFIDNEGNVIDDSSGNDNEQSVEIDGTDYKLDENGNALDKDGNVFKTKEQLEELEENGGGAGDEDEVSIKDIEKASGITITGEDGKEVEYDMTVEGLAKREKDIKQLGIKEGSTAAINNFFKSNPDLYKAYMYKSQKGSLDGFSNTPYYQSIELDKNNEDQLFNFIIEAETKRGKTPERAKAYAEFIKNNNELAEYGEESFNYLKDLEQKEFESFEQDRIEKQKEQAKKEVEFYGTYYDESGKEVVANVENSVYDKIVNKGSVGKFAIPEEGISIKTDKGQKKLSRKDIFDYISKPVENGNTQAIIDEYKNLQNMDTLLMRYISNLTGNDFSSLIEREMLKQKNKNIKKRLTTKPTNNGSGSKEKHATNQRVKLAVQ